MPSDQQEQQVGLEALKDHIRTHKIDFCLWCTRVLTMMCTFLHLFPILGNSQSAYNKALIANAATSALRLHQRQPRMSLTRETLHAILLEDSCHYLFYSLIFMYVSPFTLVLVPIFCFSLIHFASYSLTLLDTLGQNSWWGCRLLISLVELESRRILSLIALTEILLMPFTFILLFLNRAGLLTPFLYCRFLLMRYKSQRNPYTRNTFMLMRRTFEGLAAKPSTPQFIRVMITTAIQFICKFAPPISTGASSPQSGQQQ